MKKIAALLMVLSMTSAFVPAKADPCLGCTARVNHAAVVSQVVVHPSH